MTKYANQFSGDLAQRVYTSRLLGRERSLVLHGGGNTSVKIRETNLFGDEEDILYVKGSGWDLETIEAAGFAPVRMDGPAAARPARRAVRPADGQRAAQGMTDPSAPAPSVETILHAILPAKFVDHTHADALLAITNTADGRGARARDLRRPGGGRPVRHAGLRSGAAVRRALPRAGRPQTIGMVLLKHGIFSSARRRGSPTSG